MVMSTAGNMARFLRHPAEHAGEKIGYIDVNEDDDGYLDDQHDAEEELVPRCLWVVVPVGQVCDDSSER